MRLKEILRDMAKTPVLIIGDIMLDHYVFGDVERISPEAPVPVVTVEKERYVLGGAGNVARNIAALRGVPRLVGVRGADAEGEVLERLCRESGIDISLLSDDSRQTTRKTRIVAHQQQVVRVDRESVGELSDALLDGGARGRKPERRAGGGGQRLRQGAGERPVHDPAVRARPRPAGSAHGPGGPQDP